ncbi:hypothetical protein AX761_24335 [Rhizobium sp. 58]|nr:hypothetical protein AX761_24335 [Rhizobium sp. 58]
MPSLSYTLTRGDEEIDLEIEYSLSPYDPGNSCGLPEDCDPPSGGDVEEMTAFLGGEEFSLLAAEFDEIEAHILMTHEDDGDFYEEAA